MYQHGDYHIGNMMIDRGGQLHVIDFNRNDYGDPWEEFNRIVWCAQKVPLFASGMVNGYFDDNVPMEFWRLLALYISSNTLSSVYWAIPFGQDEVNTMLNQAKEVLSWYDNMRNPVPTWYFKGYYLQYIDGVPFKLKSAFDFSFMKEYGTVFKIYDDQDSGNICFGTEKDGQRMFSGIVRCADCGEKLYYCTSKNFEARQDHFVCSTSRLKGKEVCPTHFIRAVVLEQGVLAHMRMTIACVANHEEQFRKAMGAKQKSEAKRELAAKRRQLTQAERRIEELNRLFKRIYEDNANGKLSDSRFQMLSDDYEQEQEELREKLLRLNEEINEQEEQAENIDRFIGKVRKYLNLDELTPAILNDMVKAVYVHAPDKSKGYREQQIDISYDLVGILPASLLNDLQKVETA